MKKIMFATVAMAAALVMGNESITSQNVVGYNTQAIAGDALTCAAFQFSSIESGSASLKDISTTGLSAGEYETMETEAPCVMIYDGNGGYINYYYISDADDGTERYDLTGWADFSGNLADSVGVTGVGYWLRVPAATCSTGSLTESGEVLTADTATLSINAGLTLVGNPYPAVLNLGTVVTAGLVAGEYETMETEAPCVMIYDGNGGYNNYYYNSDADDGTERYDLTGWADFSGNLVTDAIAPIGTGFWVRSDVAGTLTFSL